MPTVAEVLAPVVEHIFGSRRLPVGMEFWDGSRIDPVDDPAADDSTADNPAFDDTAQTTRVKLRSPNALRRLLYAPGELGFGRAYVAGEIDLEGDIYRALDLRALLGGQREHVELHLDRRALLALARAAKRLGVLGRPLPPPAQEAHLRGRRHSKERDASAIAHHYDVGNNFYGAVLGSTMAYSCAYWASPDFTLDDAQEAKFELICRKLGLRAGMRLLDVGCGWGGMVIHAARHHGVNAVGITLAREQADLARERVADAGLTDRIEIRYQDYREVSDGPFDAISSIGMFEHVGHEQLEVYFKKLLSVLRPVGRLLNHAISSPDTRGGRVPTRSFIGRYVFPDGELLEVGRVVTAMQNLGFEVRDVESLREHYARTLRCWVANLEANWDPLVAEVGIERARVWRLYMAASAVNFEANRCSIHQVLAVKPDGFGMSGTPPTRSFATIDTERVRARQNR